SLLQYDPLVRYFETSAGELLFTAATGTPLIRYNIHDTGGILSCAQVLAWCRASGYDPHAELRAHGCGEVAPDLPFVELVGRCAFTISFSGANIYPENVKAGLEDPRVRDRLT